MTPQPPLTHQHADADLNGLREEGKEVEGKVRRGTQFGRQPTSRIHGSMAVCMLPYAWTPSSVNKILNSHPSGYVRRPFSRMDCPLTMSPTSTACALHDCLSASRRGALGGRPGAPEVPHSCRGERTGGKGVGSMACVRVPCEATTQLQTLQVGHCINCNGGAAPLPPRPSLAERHNPPLHAWVNAPCRRWAACDDAQVHHPEDAFMCINA